MRKAKVLLAALLAPNLFAQPSVNDSKSVILDRLTARAQTGGDNTLDLLILSGGGQNGAWGTGFLRGWKKRTADPMPSFDLVTGISTGSLIAPFALVGTGQALDQVTDLYRNAVDEIKPSIDPLFLIRRTGGIMNRKKLEQSIARVMDSSFAGQLRQAFSENRQLLVGTTDLDSGLGRIWQIGSELDGTSPSLAHYHRILIAATAIPGAFAPVKLDGHSHLDGGVVTNMLLGLDLGDFKELARRLQARGITAPVRIRLWVIVNLWVQPRVLAASARSVSAIRDRGNVLMFILKQQFTLTRYSELAQAVSTGVPGLSMEFHYTAVPARFADEPGARKLFDQEFMHELDATGYERGSGSNPWEETPFSPFDFGRGK